MRRCAFAFADQYKYFFSCSSIYRGIYLIHLKLYIVTCQLLYHYLFRMTYCITSRRGTSKLLELVPNPFDDINKICSKRQTLLYPLMSIIWISLHTLFNQCFHPNRLRKIKLKNPHTRFWMCQFRIKISKVSFLFNFSKTNYMCVQIKSFLHTLS